MFHLNPHNQLDAWWQHLLMIAVAALIGYIIGYRSGYSIISQLEDRFARLGVDLEKCRKSLIALSSAPALAVQSPAAETADDLKVIEGVGPKIEKLLNQSGIRTFRQLSNTSTEHLKAILDNAGPRFQIHDPSTWARQALMAHEGRWDELKKWQAELDGGRQESTSGII